MGETSKSILVRVQAARDIQTKRYSSIRNSNTELPKIVCNADMRVGRSGSFVDYLMLVNDGFRNCTFAQQGLMTGLRSAPLHCVSSRLNNSSRSLKFRCNLKPKNRTISLLRWISPVEIVRFFHTGRNHRHYKPIQLHSP